MHTLPRLILATLTAALLSACAHRNPTVISLDQSTPQAGLLAYAEAINTADAATIRECIYVPIRYKRVGDTMAEMHASFSQYRVAMTRHFPDKPLPIDLHSMGGAPVDALREHLKSAKVDVQGDQAVILEPEPKGILRPPLVGTDWKLRRDHGRWKLDHAGPADHLKVVDDYLRKRQPPDSRLGEFAVFLDIYPDLRRIAMDIESGKISTYEESKSQTDAVVSAAFNEIVNHNGAPAKAPSK